MPPEASNWKTRLLAEYTQLKDRLIKLEQFVRTDVFWNLPYSDQDDLMDQVRAMREYYLVLFRRLARVDVEGKDA